MKFWTDGSRVGKVGNFVIGWAAVCNSKVLVAKSRVGGSNINAEIFAIRDLLKNLKSYNRRLVEQIKEENDNIEIITDSKTSIQIIEGYMNYPNEYNVNESENYLAAKEICELIDYFNSIGIQVNFKHIRGHQNNLGNTFADYVATTQSKILLNNLEVS